MFHQHATPQTRINNNSAAIIKEEERLQKMTHEIPAVQVTLTLSGHFEKSLEAAISPPIVPFSNVAAAIS